MAQHDGLVHAYIQRQGGGKLPYEEALQAGRIGLWQAIRGYDPSRGTAFSSYAWVAIWRQVYRRGKELSRETAVSRPWPEMPASWVRPDPAEEVDQELTVGALHDLVNQLPKRLRRVIIARYGLGEQPPCTLKELGEELDLSGERVRQLQQEALAWLRYPAHSWRLRQLLGKNTATDYRRALAQNAALRRARRKRR
jgi:RNA polymerase sigma factor (sigma-70 family)